jgi:hypothetical protein
VTLRGQKRLEAKVELLLAQVQSLLEAVEQLEVVEPVLSEEAGEPEVPEGMYG